MKTEWVPIKETSKIELTANAYDGSKHYFIDVSACRFKGNNIVGNKEKPYIKITDLGGTTHTVEGLRSLSKLLNEAADFAEEWIGK